MGEVDLHFKSSVPTFDACVALGRRFDRYVREDTVEGTIDVMDKAGVDKALVYSPHSIDFDAEEGNALLMEQIQGQPRLVPQFAVNPSYDDMEAFGATLHELSVRSVRMAPEKHRYPFRDWVVGPWLEWLASEKLPLWLDAMQLDPVDLYDTAKSFPDTQIVMSEVHYSHVGWALPMLKSLPNLSIEISRLLIPDGVNTLIDAIGFERVMFGSRFPDSPMAPMLYSLHRSGLSDEELRAIAPGTSNGCWLPTEASGAIDAGTSADVSLAIVERDTCKPARVSQYYRSSFPGVRRYDANDRCCHHRRWSNRMLHCLPTLQTRHHQHGL